ncbi:MAG: PEP-CTERM sorting domain-containing protein [Xanthobacteraceae bacterium]|nr:PEP-CTERM sorting domain-containing protein [Xanthobacteraceae bacterium]
MRINSVLIGSALAAILACAAVSSANATTLVSNAGWTIVDDYPYDGNGNLSFFSETFTAAGKEDVRVTGIYALGNQFDVFVNNVLVATATSKDWASLAGAPSDPSALQALGLPYYTSNPDAAFGTTGPNAFAKAVFGVNAGDVITIEATAVPSTYFDGAFAISAVPEPSTWAMILLGFAGIGFVTYKRSRRALAA